MGRAPADAAFLRLLVAAGAFITATDAFHLSTGVSGAPVSREPLPIRGGCWRAQPQAPLAPLAFTAARRGRADAAVLHAQIGDGDEQVRAERRWEEFGLQLVMINKT